MKQWNYGLAHELPPSDDRQKAWSRQREERGFDDTELWALDAAISKFLVPRLIAFRDLEAGYPPCFQNLDEWTAVLNKMIRAFQLCSEDRVIFTKEEAAQMEEGRKLFHSYFHNLWY